MFSSPESVGASITYIVGLSICRICLFVWTDLVTTISQERLERSDKT